MEKTTIEKSLAENGFHIATVKGDSMMPLLRQGKDLVKVVPATKDKLQKYDVALFKRPTGEYVLHRIFSIKKDYCIICGDNRFLKEKIPFEWIIGVAESVYINNEEIKMSGERQMNYAKKIYKTFWSRRIKHWIKKVVC